MGLAGASGSIYALRFLKALSEIPGETFLVVSPPSLRIFSEEYNTSVSKPEDILDYISNHYKLGSAHRFHIRNFHDIGSDIASGSNVWSAMVVVPCSMKTIASISAGLTENLIERAADVSLKERRRLIVVPRETPYNRVHLRNLLSLDEAGAIILPASPGFYQMPKTLDDLGDFIAGRILNLLGVEHSLFPKWEG